MAIPTGERSFHKTQIGFESTEGTAVDADTLIPAESGAIIELDRAAASPEEDWGELAAHQPGRSVYGVRQATVPIRGTVRFDDIMRIFESAIAGGVSPTGANPYTWTYTMDNASDTLIPVTIQDGDNKYVYRMPGSYVQRLRLSYDAVSPGNASPWMFEATYIGRDKEEHAAGFSVASAPASMETAMGHLTRLYYGTTGTAFGALSEVAGALLAFDMTIETGIVLRKQGGQGDKADSHGRQKPVVTFTMLVEQIAGTKTGHWDVFESDAGNPVIPTRRMRVKVVGSNVESDETVTIEHGGTVVATGGTFTLTFGGDTTSAIDWNASAAVVQAKLQALDAIGPGNVQVSGNHTDGWTVRFINDLGATNVGAITFDDTGLTGGTAPTLVVTVILTGAAGVAKSMTIDGSVEIDQMPVQEGDGSTRYSIQGRYVKDATLASQLQIAVVNDIAA